MTDTPTKGHNGAPGHTPRGAALIDMRAVTAAIARGRLKTGKTLEKLGAGAGIGRDQVSKILGGDSWPGYPTAFYLARAAGLRIVAVPADLSDEDLLNCVQQSEAGRTA